MEPVLTVSIESAVAKGTLNTWGRRLSWTDFHMELLGRVQGTTVRARSHVLMVRN